MPFDYREFYLTLTLVTAFLAVVFGDRGAARAVTIILMGWIASSFIKGNEPYNPVHNMVMDFLFLILIHIVWYLDGKHFLLNCLRFTTFAAVALHIFQASFPVDPYRYGELYNLLFVIPLPLVCWYSIRHWYLARNA